MDIVKDQAPTPHLRLVSAVLPAPDPIPLSSTLWFDPATHAILHKGKQAPLTARVTRLITTLLHAPNCFHSVETLARLLTPPGAVQIDPHCVEQTIYGLRRKLGEHGRHPRLLINRRDIGYGLFLPKIAPPGQSETRQPRQSQARKRSKNLNQL